jgi:hypothetical protein
LPASLSGATPVALFASEQQSPTGGTGVGGDQKPPALLNRGFTTLLKIEPNE